MGNTLDSDTPPFGQLVGVATPDMVDSKAIVDSKVPPGTQINVSAGQRQVTALVTRYVTIAFLPSLRMRHSKVFI